MYRYAVEFLLAALVAGAVAGCGNDGGDVAIDAAPSDGAPLIDAAPRQIIMETQSLAPGELAEAIFTGGPSDRATIHLAAPVSELDWNIHGHANGATQTIYEELNRLTVDYVFTPSAQADWWLLLRNSGPTAMTIDIRVELYDDMQWRWQ